MEDITLLMFVICSSLILFPSAAIELCNYTIEFYDFSSGPRIRCNEQSASVKLSNLNGDSAQVTGLKGSFCGGNSATVMAPCDYCIITINVSPQRMVPGLVTVFREGMLENEYFFRFSSEVLTECPGFNVASNFAIGFNREFFLFPTTCMYNSRSNFLMCPGCSASGTCSYSIKLDAQTLFLCVTSQKIEVSIYNDYDRNVGRGSGESAAFVASRSDFQQGITVIGRCVDFCAVGVQIYDTSCSYQVNQVGETLSPNQVIFLRNYASVYRTQCGRPNPYPIMIGGTTVLVPRACETNFTATPTRITCPC
ncbi:hypothetical protein SELMODRAFT_445573 [Selaginella moellendorffii]|uniref:Wall-associated receptor kinase galacturonan-binding domain-containing protein n=1 Tax=Selaginella moellendorffii TaxID=88036 RepID=D8SJN1_SELML|nr:hypothetical protein SELMODRAFT_445573 [Selaginella moellendorffii]